MVKLVRPHLRTPSNPPCCEWHYALIVEWCVRYALSRKPVECSQQEHAVRGISHFDLPECPSLEAAILDLIVSLSEGNDS